MNEVGTALTPGMLTPEQVFLFENHDEAYYIWRDHAIKNRIVIHIDAHHDMYGQWTVVKGVRPRISIANYIYPSVEEGMVREVVWVIPDATLASRSGRQKCAEMVSQISADDPATPPDRRAPKSRHGTLVLGRPLRFCTLDDLSGITEPVLLDIDIDYLTTPDITERGNTCYGDKPWCWPSELIERLTHSGLKTDLVTIAWSVTGGYTPLQWKYLGDEVAARMSDSADAALLRAAEHIHSATSVVRQKDWPAAEANLLQARNLWPTSAAPAFHLAHLLLATNRLEAARALYREALERDDSYRTPFNSAGLVYYEDKRFDSANNAFQRMLALHPEDANALCGLGLVASRQKHWAEAEEHFLAALAIDPKLVDACRGLGRALIELRRGAEAIRTLERSLTLTLSGRKSMLDAMIMKSNGEGSFSDPFHAQVHSKLGDLYAAKGDVSTAINAYRMGIAMGEDSPAVSLHLARLYLLRKDWGKCAGQLVSMLGRLPGEMARAIRRLCRRLKRRTRGVRQRVQSATPSLWCE